MYSSRPIPQPRAVIKVPTSTEDSILSKRAFSTFRILPLIGGSGGGGRSNAAQTGGAGGGALLLVVTQDINITGVIQARGGSHRYNSGGGSGGAVRVIAETISGAGKIEAIPWNVSGGDGRIRLETINFNDNLRTFPSVPINAPDEPLVLWLPEAAPRISIVSVGVHTVPTDPTGSPQTSEIDFQMDNESISNIILEANNVPSDASVKVRIVPVNGNPVTETAIFNSGTDAVSTWVVSDVSLPVGPFVIQAHSINPTP